MGIGLRPGTKDWYEIVQKNREKHPCPCKKRPGHFCTFHGWLFSGSPQGLNNIKTTPEAEKCIKEGMLKYDDKGNPLPSTERGKRRRQRLGKKPHLQSGN